MLTEHEHKLGTSERRLRTNSALSNSTCTAHRGDFYLDALPSLLRVFMARKVGVRGAEVRRLRVAVPRVSPSYGHCPMNLEDIAWQLNARQSKGEQEFRCHKKKAKGEEIQEWEKGGRLFLFMRANTTFRFQWDGGRSMQRRRRRRGQKPRCHRLWAHPNVKGWDNRHAINTVVLAKGPCSLFCFRDSCLCGTFSPRRSPDEIARVNIPPSCPSRGCNGAPPPHPCSPPPRARADESFQQS
jgi:hypothetical protein